MHTQPAILTQPATTRARAFLWGQDPDVAHLMPLILARAGIAVSVVDSADALLAADLQGDAAFLIIDCSVGSDALDRCLLVVTRTVRPVHICHPRQDFVADLVPLVRGPLLWLPPAWTGLFLLDKARILLAQAEAKEIAVPAPPRPMASIAPSPLTSRQHQTQRFVAQDLTNDQIAGRMGITKRTVKQHIADGMGRLGLHARRAFGAAYQDEGQDPPQGD